MNPSEDISVVVPVFNGEKFIEETLLSVARQTTLPLEIIVVDDGSQDNTCELIESFSCAYPEITTTLVKSQHLGPGAARNTGIAAARGSWVAFLDSDDLWLPNKIDLVASAYINNSYANFICHNEIHRRDSMDMMVDYFSKYDEEKSLSPQLFNGCFLSTSAIICKKSLLTHFGGFDNSFPNAQDYELWLRMSPKISLLMLPDVLGVYVVRSGNITSRPLWTRSKNVYRVIRGNKSLVSKYAYIIRITKHVVLTALEYAKILK
jgi:glycosyltransferase involved in cell wall biosynthesis